MLLSVSANSDRQMTVFSLYEELTLSHWIACLHSTPGGVSLYDMAICSAIVGIAGGQFFRISECSVHHEPAFPPFRGYQSIQNAVQNRRFFTSFFGSEQLDSLANPPKSEYELQTAKSDNPDDPNSCAADCGLRKHSVAACAGTKRRSVARAG